MIFISWLKEGVIKLDADLHRKIFWEKIEILNVVVQLMEWPFLTKVRIII